jgi:hypothetical protein
MASWTFIGQGGANICFGGTGELEVSSHNAPTQFIVIRHLRIVPRLQVHRGFTRDRLVHILTMHCAIAH